LAKLIDNILYRYYDSEERSKAISDAKEGGRGIIIYEIKYMKLFIILIYYYYSYSNLFNLNRFCRF
jgi:hypothetical protein